MKHKIVINYIEKVTKVIRHYSIFLLLFGLIKLISFSAPLFLSNLVESSEQYGFVEYILSFGALIAGPLTAGFHGAFPYFYLKKKEKNLNSIFYSHGILVGAIVLVVFLLYFTTIIQLKIFLAVLVGSNLALQLIISSMLKSREIINKAVVIDAGLYLVLNLFNLGLLVFFDFSVVFLSYFLGFYFVGLFSYYLFKYFKSEQWSLSKYKTVVKFGSNLVVSSFLIIALTGSARIIIEYFLSYQEVAIYGLYFRLASVVVLIHQALNISFFKKIYIASPRTLDKYFAMFLGGIFLLSFTFYKLLPVIALPFFKILEDTFWENKNLYLLICVQVVFWISLALNENIINRENLAKKFNSVVLVLVILMISFLTIANHFKLLTLFNIVVVNMVCIYLATEIQFYLMNRERSFKFYKTRLVNLSILLIFLSYNILF